MADLAGDPYGYDSPSRRGWARQAALAAGAVAAIGLAVGLVNWGHGLLTRDAGLVPFLRAEDGPMKIVPEDPGGIKLARTDQAVTSIIAGPREADPAYAPAPELPEDEDLAQPYLKPPASPGVDGRVVAGAPASAPGTAASATPPAPVVEGGDDAIQAALARAAAEATAAADADGDAQGADVGSPRAPSAMAVAPARPKPPAPGSRVASAPATATATPAAAPAATSAPAASGAGIAAGDVVIQLGAFNSHEIAESQWRRATRRNGDLLAPYGHIVTTVESGGRTLFRLRVGPMPERQRAQDICAALKARGDACIVATVR